MSLHSAENSSSPFSEIRQVERDRLLFVIAAATLSAASFVVAAALVAIGVIA